MLYIQVVSIYDQFNYNPEFRCSREKERKCRLCDCQVLHVLFNWTGVLPDSRLRCFGVCSCMTRLDSSDHRTYTNAPGHGERGRTVLWLRLMRSISGGLHVNARSQTANPQHVTKAENNKQQRQQQLPPTKHRPQHLPPTSTSSLTINQNIKTTPISISNSNQNL